MSQKENSNPTEEPTSAFEEREIEEVRDWRNEHGEPDVAYLLSLVKDGSIEAIEKLRAIADDLDVGNPDIAPADLVDLIRLTVRENDDSGFEATS